MDGQANALSNETSHSLQVSFSSQILMKEGLDSQKGSRTASEGLINTAEWLKSNGLLGEVLDVLEKDGFAKVKHKADGSPAEITFDKDLPGYPRNPITLNLDKMQVNQRDKKVLSEEAAKERKDFSEARLQASNRPLPEGYSTKLDSSQIPLLKTLENGILSGNLEPIRKAFQSSPSNTSLWKRMSAEVSADYNAPAAMRFGKDPTGRPYLAIISENDTPQLHLEAIVIPSTGSAKAFLLDEQGEIDFKTPAKRTAEQSMIDVQQKRLSALEEKMSDYRCDFDVHERTEKSKLGLDISQKQIVQKYNSYSEHFCGAEFED